MSILAALAVAVAVAQTADTPRVTHVAPVSSNILAITIETGRLLEATQEVYTVRNNDEIDRSGNTRWLTRHGKVVGTLVGREEKLLYTFDSVEGASLDTARTDLPGSWVVSSADAPAYTNGTNPQAVFRKSKPTEMARTGTWDWAFPVRHVIYLQLPSPLKEGCTYSVRAQGGLIPEQAYTHSPEQAESEALHVSQIGFHPRDPVKVAFLSCWLGSGGRLTYPAGLRFALLDNSTAEVAYKGEVVLAKAADDCTEDSCNRNYSGTDVYRLDFSSFDRPGTYRICVDGIGCSKSFPIADDVWKKAFRIAARGFYHQRSGIALGPPYTDFERPRSFHPDDGLKVYLSSCSLLNSGNGLNALGTDKDNFGNLVAGRTGDTVTNAWGGYFDAGDWDRRIQHLEASRLLLEIYRLFPSDVGSMSLNIPESGNKLPDLLDEALWNLDFFRRLQTTDGGIRGGAESSEHPRHGEGSWQESQAVMAYAPDPWSSYVYAGVAARAACCLGSINPLLSKTYAVSALSAMTYAEEQFAGLDPAETPHAVRDARNLAAAELFRSTGDARWHDLFLATTVFTNPAATLFEWKHHEQRDAAFVYARTKHATINAGVQQNALSAIFREADESVAQGKRTGFGWTKIHSWAPVGWGCLSTPQVTTLLRAHSLSGRDEYLRAALLATQAGAGANPVNLCYTTGVGQEWPHNPLWHDARVMAKEPPPGLTVYGPMDVRRNKDHWCLKVLAPAIYPPIEQWPTMETYFDVSVFPETTEFTVMQTMGPNTYAWGYLAGTARK